MISCNQGSKKQFHDAQPSQGKKEKKGDQARKKKKIKKTPSLQISTTTLPRSLILTHKRHQGKNQAQSIVTSNVD
ncbi:uncharacterized protein BO96DRAFT_237519 [Aspergillus niger CBS 101883]|uniref:uncharacterized protein n=1 Tax=Aspergillus lacticoffeatus (strain CBS 101883) TaxID=1450533 RepID=UPI000D7F0CA6|nr:uncharacterized protein BO96DRAFT_237519 [Aspergillus niger CBS 101883]PYH50266.1 hypothetical protein BO96DRAFT_237519 [Aspergillus niger CBS 101883]